jgi:hypothetical protein
MRSFAPIALFGSLVLAAGLDAQSLTEHAAAAAGATIGTAAGKPLSNALGNIFGNVDKQTSQAAGAKSAKKVEKVEKVEKPAGPAQAKPSASAPGLGAPSAGAATFGDLKRSPAPRWQGPLPSAPEPVAPAASVLVPAIPSVREPSAADLASIKVGASGQELQSALGAPESRVTIPDDDGSMREICQYWSKGQQIGTVRLVNGQVVSVVANSN